ncbi:hypothetical protein [Christiangramia sp.]|uniref:hypothetical protein n=1 Tax=Christiangramia sp. TaxID=1931228 RepID=UPI0026201609|nr:hypothetical protein [Christiangramia sp.]
MKFLGGDITEIVCKHPSLGDFRFQTKSNESYTMDKGGYRNNDDANQVTGGGQAIWQKNRVRWSLEGPILEDLTQNEKNIEVLAESSEEGTWIISHISGAIWQGKGNVVGDLQTDTNNVQKAMKIAGGGKLEPVN